jgi:hypothetical protein
MVTLSGTGITGANRQIIESAFIAVSVKSPLHSLMQTDLARMA